MVVEIQVLYEGGTPIFTWNETLNFDDQSYEAFAIEMAQSLKTEYLFSIDLDYHVNGNHQTIDIVDVTYALEQAKDGAGVKRWCLVFHFVLDPSHYITWRTNAQTDVNLQVFGGEAPPDPAQTYENVTKWRLIKADGTFLESGQGENIIKLPGGPIDFASEEDAKAYAAQLLKEYPQFRVECNYNSWPTHNMKVLDVTFDYFANNGAVYKVTTWDTFRWHRDKGGEIATFYILVPDSSPPPTERRGVNGWRLVVKGTSSPAVTAYNDNSPYLLPNVVEGTGEDGYREYAKTLLERYDFQVSFDGNKTFTTYELKSFAHQSNGTYLIVPADNFFWSWGNALNPRIRVRENDDPLELRNCTDWGVAGGGTTGINNKLVIGWAKYDDEVEGQEADFAAYLKKIYPYLTVQQDGTWVSTIITGIEYDEAESDRYNSSGIRKNAVYKVTVHDHFYTSNGQPAVFYIVITGEGDFGPLEIITVKAKDPDGIRMNLFDYWINQDPSNEAGNPWEDLGWAEAYDWREFDYGINYAHALKFFNMGYANEDHKEFRDQLGWWNYGTENRVKNVTGIVQPILRKRYPQLALDPPGYTNPGNVDPGKNIAPVLHSGTEKEKMTESLAYLFDPTYEHKGKASYANVSGLFQRDSNGYYYYDSKLNFAQFDELYNSFILYSSKGVAANSSASPDGQFFPFAGAGTVFNSTTDDETGETTLTRTSVQSRSYALNHFFGFSMEIDFQQPKDGIVNLGDQKENMVFQFSGDDDVWVFVDGVLVLDLGGVHSGIYGEIDFATGRVTTQLMDIYAPGAAGTGPLWTNTTLKEIFLAAQRDYGLGYGMENDIYFDPNDPDEITFKANSLHTLKVFYLERGHFDSNFAMYFNLQARVPHKIYKVDEDGAPLAGASFAVYAAKPSGTFKGNEKYHSADEFEPTDKDGNAVSWDAAEPLNAELVTGADGYATLGGIDFANRAANGKVYYFLEETSSASGYRVLPERLVLEFIPDSNYPQRGVFKVLNQYETGAYASFSAILENAAEYDSENNDFKLYYATATLDPVTGDMKISMAMEDEENGQTISSVHKESAMLFAVPMIYTNIGAGQRWYPIYGSNTNGYHVVDIYKDAEYYTHADNSGYTAGTDDGVQAAFRWALRHNLLAAAMRQVADVSAPDWYFRYETVTAKGEPLYSRFTAELYNLPGEKDRYLLNNSNVDINVADLRLVGLLVDAEAIMALINHHGGSVTEEEFQALNDEEKYILLQNTLQEQGFEAAWDTAYNATTPNWSDIRSILDNAYVQHTDGTTRGRGVNLAHIDEFTRYYGSVFYIPNERRELRVLKQDPMGNPLEGAEFGLFPTFEDAVNGTNMLNKKPGITGKNGILIFSVKKDESPANEGSGFTEMDWDVFSDPDMDNTVWLKELKAPDGFALNQSIVQIYVGARTIYANASAFEANEQKQPIMIDDPESGEGTDGVTVLASVGKLFQSMEKFADPLLNATLLDIDGRAKSFIPNSVKDNPDEANWVDTNDDLFRLHFWDRRELGYTSSDYSTAHKKSANGSIGGEAFAVTENGYLQVHPTQTPKSVFESQHAGETATRDSRRETLFYSDGTPLDLYNIFSTVNVVVIRNEYEGDADLRITKLVEGDAPGTENKQYTFLITGPEEAAGKTYDVEGATDTTVTFTSDAPYTAEVTVTGAGTVTLKKLPSGTYIVTEVLEGAGIDGYQLDVSYSAVNVTVEEGKTAVFTVTNRYLNELECKLTITDGGRYGEENCGQENEIFLYKVTGTTATGEKIELIVSVPGGGSTTVVVPAGHYTVEEQPDWSWKYKNKKTVGDAPADEWEISADWITAKRQLRLTEEKEVVYYHETSDKTWQGDESSIDNLFNAPSTPTDKEPERDPHAQQVTLPAAIEEERKPLFSADEPDPTQ